MIRLLSDRSPNLSAQGATRLPVFLLACLCLAIPVATPWAAGSDSNLIRFDKNPANAREPEFPLAGATVDGVMQGLVPLVAERDYHVKEGKLFFTTRYANDLKGKTKLTLRLHDGSTREVVLLVRDSSKSAPGLDFNPPPGSYGSPQHVIVTSPAVDGTIRFTTDGSDPTAKSRSVGYTTVLVDRTLTIKARTFVKGKEPGPVSTANYRITGSGKPAPLPPERVLDPSPGAGAYEVYVGAAFYMDEMLDRGQWSYVADTADGLYHRFLGVDPLGADGQKQLGSYFKGGKAVLEGGLRGPQHVSQDLEWIDQVKAMGLRPVATFVNGLNSSEKQDPTDLTEPWKQRIALNRQAGLDSFTMQAPHRIADEGGWADSRYDRTRRWTLMSAGTSADAPTYLFTRREDRYRQAVFDLVHWTHQNNRKFLFIVSPNEGSDSFLQDTIMTVRLLEDNRAAPDFYGVTLYGKRALHLVPEAVLDKSGGRTGTSTLTGAAYYLLKHARADGGELDLWLDGGNGRNWFQDAVGSAPEARTTGSAPVSMASLSGSLDLVITNRSSWVDFIPVLRAKSDSASAKAGFRLGDKDITANVLGEGFTFLGPDRLLPGQSRKVSLSWPAHNAGTLTIDLLPYPGSRFVRDHITLGP